MTAHDRLFVAAGEACVRPRSGRYLGFQQARCDIRIATAAPPNAAFGSCYTTCAQPAFRSSWRSLRSAAATGPAHDRLFVAAGEACVRPRSGRYLVIQQARCDTRIATASPPNAAFGSCYRARARPVFCSSWRSLRSAAQRSLFGFPAGTLRHQDCDGCAAERRLRQLLHDLRTTGFL
ncbi:hypothetical protein ABIA48_004981 [Pseudomonas sp. S30_BP2TU TE3576]